MIIGCSGWSYADPVEKGGWTKVFYPTAQTKKLQYYSQFFNTAEMDATFYEKFYKYMTKETFSAMTNATPDDFQFSVKVPETVTHEKRLDVNRMEFRNPSWQTEGPWDMLKHYNISAVITDSPPQDKLQFLSEVTVTADHSFIRWHGRNDKHRYNYPYSKEELKPWVEKVKQISIESPVVRGYFNNHYGARAVVNALEFKEMLGTVLSEKEKAALEHARNYFSETSSQLTLDKSLKQ
ncbi:MAG: DUF72 domain-containing protein [Thaumarchaeota archaeon]|nr:MAG: DUF72 domain-containing protein [Nitrososphaerota archaeon]